jgi:hypothetical protein
VSSTALDTMTIQRWKRYPTYRDTEPVWIERLPVTWQIHKLKRLLIANDGGIWGEDFDEDGTIVLRSTDMTAAIGTYLTLLDEGYH